MGSLEWRSRPGGCRAGEKRALEFDQGDLFVLPHTSLAVTHEVGRLAGLGLGFLGLELGGSMGALSTDWGRGLG